MPGFAKNGSAKEKKQESFYSPSTVPIRKEVRKEGQGEGKENAARNKSRPRQKKKLARLRLHRAFDAVSAAQNEEKAGELDSQHKHLCNNDVADSVTNERC